MTTLDLTRICDNCGEWHDTGTEYCSECLATLADMSYPAPSVLYSSTLLKGWKV